MRTFEQVRAERAYKSGPLPKIKDFWPQIFNSRLVLEHVELRVFADFGVLPDAGSFGAIDYLASNGGRTVLIEEDMGGSDKWHWTKIMAYRAAFILDNPGRAHGKRKPLMAVMLPTALYNFQLRNILAVCGVEGFWFDWRDGRYHCTRATRPEWLRS